MKIGFITTIDTNIGDDFIRTGIENIVFSLVEKENITLTYVNKHQPETAIIGKSPFHLLKKFPAFRGKHYLYKVYDRFLYKYFSVFRKQDLIIQSGAPVLWPGCSENEWARPIWYNTIGKLYKKVPVLNLAAGSCFPWESNTGQLAPRDKKYASDIGSFCRLTTTRDMLAKKLFESAGVENKLLPCTAFFVDKNFSNDQEGKYILINYMEGGGHFDWDQHIDKQHWDNVVKELINSLKSEHEIRFICHSEKEVEIAGKLDPSIKTIFPKNVSEYLEVIRGAKLGINNRMHASVAMGSVGVPAISICTDTRLLMLDNIGLPIWYVKDVESEKLIQQAKDLITNFSLERKRLFDMKKQKFEEYQLILKPFLQK